LAHQFNELANKDNMLLRSKLNCNKGDFERLRKLGTNGRGAMGADLENKIKD